MLAEPQTTDPKTVANDDLSDARDQEALTAAAKKAVRAAGRSPFETALDRWRLLCVHRDELDAAGDDDGREIAEQAVDDALDAVLQTRAMTVGEIAEKGRVFISTFMGRSGWEGAHPDNPAYLSHLMCDGYEERALIALYQDAAFLTGCPQELADASPTPFRARHWLTETLGSLRVRRHWDGNARSLTFGGADAEKATAAFEALPPWHQSEVKDHFSNQSRMLRQQAEQPRWSAAHTDPNIIRCYADSTAYTVAKTDPVRRAEIRAQLRDSMRAAVGLPVGLDGFDAERFVLAAYAEGMRFTLQNHDFGPNILHRTGDSRPDTTAICDRFAQLDRHQVEALTDYLSVHTTWAAEWTARVSAETGCLVTFHDSGVGFSIGADATGGLLEASAMFNALTEVEALHLKAYAWSQFEKACAAEKAASR
ncbi:hypothetical protein [Brevundimonas sp. CEF1]|uniref:hypothetical protein n=1 Tax=Brevundimonas sp. CEF1 TaxID=3442642 RepID=UPI003F5144CD